MNAVPLDAHRDRDMGIVLKHLTAEYESGRLRGLAVCAKVGRSEQISLTGAYRDFALASHAAIRMTRRIHEMEDESEGR